MTTDVRDLGAPTPRPAATLVLVRASPSGPEVLLTTRPKELRFMGGVTVFPGGAVAPEDRDPRWDRASVLDRVGAARRIPDLGEDALAAHVCALREAHEEVGLWFAEGPGPSRTPSAEEFLVNCLQLGAKLRTDLLVAAGSWVTPLGSPMRFDARFFVVEAPGGWEPDPDPHEVARSMWMTPARALVEVSSGTLTMAPPTIEMLQRLDGHESVEEAIEAVRTRGLTGAGSVISIRLSPTVHLVLAPNPGVMTGPGTNSYVVGTGPHAVVDPAVDDPEYLEELVSVAGDVTAILVTHRHPDHVGGIHALVERLGIPVRAFGDAPAGGVDVEPVSDEEVLSFGATTLRALHTPGHSSDHVCFYIDGAASLLSGDVILGEGTAVIAPPDGDMAAYLRSLHRLGSLHIDRIYPGHFRPLDGGAAVIDHYISHRAAREASILDAVRAGVDTEDAIVAEVYVDTPAALHPIARFSVRAHLEMLASRGVVQQVDQRWEPGPRD